VHLSCEVRQQGMTARGIATAMGHSSVEAVFREADAGTGSKGSGPAAATAAQQTIPAVRPRHAGNLSASARV